MSDPAQVLAALLQLEQAQAVAKNARITIESAVDNGWMLITSTLIFFMQARSPLSTSFFFFLHLSYFVFT